MTKQSSKKLIEAGRVCGVDVKFRSSGTQRVTAIINGRTYGGINAAMDAITNIYLKQKKGL